MKKKSALKSIKDLSKVLTSDLAKKAIEVLLKEASNLVDEVKAPLSKSDLPLPKEIIGDDSKIALFTDGACRGNPGPGAWAYMIQDHNEDIVHEKAMVSELTTNNKMELGAIVKGLEYLLESEPFKYVYVYTDSKYAVDGMKSWVAGWKKRGWKKADKKAPENLELWQRLDSLNSQLRVEFHWVKGHSGHPQNEYVDQLANKALDEKGF